MTCFYKSICILNHLKMYKIHIENIYNCRYLKNFTYFSLGVLFSDQQKTSRWKIIYVEDLFASIHSKAIVIHLSAVLSIRRDQIILTTTSKLWSSTWTWNNLRRRPKQSGLVTQMILRHHTPRTSRRVSWILLFCTSKKYFFNLITWIKFLLGQILPNGIGLLVTQRPVRETELPEFGL